MSPKVFFDPSPIEFRDNVRALGVHAGFRYIGGGLGFDPEKAQNERGFKGSRKGPDPGFSGFGPLLRPKRRKSAKS